MAFPQFPNSRPPMDEDEERTIFGTTSVVKSSFIVAVGKRVLFDGWHCAL